MTMRHPLGTVEDESSELPRRTSLLSVPALGEAQLRLDTGMGLHSRGLSLTQNMSYTDCLWLRDLLDKHIEATVKFANARHTDQADRNFAQTLRKQMEAHNG